MSPQKVVFGPELAWNDPVYYNQTPLREYHGDECGYYPNHKPCYIRKSQSTCINVRELVSKGL